jgi:hypothetical protein
MDIGADADDGASTPGQLDRHPAGAATRAQHGGRREPHQESGPPCTSMPDAASASKRCW